VEYNQQQRDAFKEVTHIGKFTGTMFRIKEDSSLADFLWQNQAYWQRSDVTKEMILTEDKYFEEFTFNEEDFV